MTTRTAQPAIRAFFHEPTHTVTYLVWDLATRTGAVIDPVVDFDHRSGRLWDAALNEVLQAALDARVRIAWVLETHAHADHLTGAPTIKARTGAKVGIGERIADVQTLFRSVFGAEDVSGSGAEFDRLFRDGETFSIGELKVEVLHTPGHTPACVSYRIGDAVFVGDTLFMPDFGTARADFPGGDARTLYRSIQRLLDLPGTTRLFMCHDYQAPGRDSYAWVSTVAEQRAANIHVGAGKGEDEFVALREERDRTLAAPTLLLPSIQVNIRAGRLPPPDADGARRLRLPLQGADGVDGVL